SLRLSDQCLTEIKVLPWYGRRTRVRGVFCGPGGRLTLLTFVATRADPDFRLICLNLAAICRQLPRKHSRSTSRLHVYRMHCSPACRRRPALGDTLWIWT